MTFPLYQWLDDAYRSAASHMAIDEALFLDSIADGVPAARFYRWEKPAVTVGYFYDSSTEPPGGPEPVRRMTGGDRVEHGEDITFVLCFPSDTPLAQLSTAERYTRIHQALAGALTLHGMQVELAAAEAPATTGPCFENAVPSDLIDSNTGRKIAGGAQRRSRGAVIHQGSVRLPRELRTIEHLWIDSFLEKLGADFSRLPAERVAAILQLASILETEKYDTDLWNRRGFDRLDSAQPVEKH